MAETFGIFARFERQKDGKSVRRFKVAATLEQVKQPYAEKKIERKRNRRKNKEENGFSVLSEDFTEIIQGLNSTIGSILRIVPVAQSVEVEVSIYNYCKDNGKVVEENDEFVVYGLHQYNYGDLSRRFSRLDALMSGMKIVPELFILGLISTYDAFLSNLIKQMFESKPELLSSSERKLTFSELSHFDNIDAARLHIVEKEVESVIRQSHADHFVWLESKLGITLRKDLDIWPDFIELCERRNLLTHTGGIVSSQYMAVCRNHGCDLKDRSVGERLEISRAYVRKAVDVIEELGVKLIQVVWRKLLPDEVEKASESLSSTTYDLIVHRRYRMAIKLLEFGLSLKNTGPERVRKMMIVNMANAQKLSGDKEAAEKTLQQTDWSATADEFQICIAAIRDNLSEVVALMPKVAASQSVTAVDFREWPVFELLRKEEEFATQFEKNFGEPLSLRKIAAEKSDASAEAEGPSRLESPKAADNEETEKPDLNDPSDTVH